MITLAYAWGKLHKPEMMNNPFYKPVYSFGRFAETWDVYMGHLLVTREHTPTWVSMTILGGLLVVALVTRSRRLVFAWVVIVFGMLPVSFSPARGTYVMYLSFVGWVLYAGVVLVALQDVVVRRHP